MVCMESQIFLQTAQLSVVFQRSRLTSKLLAPTSEVPRCYEAVVEGDATKPLEDGGHSWSVGAMKKHQMG